MHIVIQWKFICRFQLFLLTLSFSIIILGWSTVMRILCCLRKLVHFSSRFISCPSYSHLLGFSSRCQSNIFPDIFIACSDCCWPMIYWWLNFFTAKLSVCGFFIFSGLYAIDRAGLCPALSMTCEMSVLCLLPMNYAFTSRLCLCWGHYPHECWAQEAPPHACNISVADPYFQWSTYHTTARVLF